MGNTLPRTGQPITNSSAAPGATVRACYNFDAREAGDLSFKKGDRLLILSDFNSDWPKARNLTTLQEGCIPSNHVTKDNDSLRHQEWWFDVDRREACRLLQMPENSPGSFLLRPSQEVNVEAVLSLLNNTTSTSPKETIKHIKIRCKPNGQVYLSAKTLFWSLASLIEHYTTCPVYDCGGQEFRLTTPCYRKPDPLPLRAIEIARHAIQQIERIGEGHFGEVWRGTLYGRDEVAIKVMKDERMSPDSFLKEAELMHRLHHPKLVQLLGVCTQSEPMCLVAELMVHGSLVNYLRDDDGSTLTYEHLMDMAAQVAQGMAYLEKHNFIHRDLRAGNILVGQHNVYKIADFGMARLIQLDKDEGEAVYFSQQSKFPVRWTAPEGLCRIFTIKSDVWSFGILVYEIVTFGRVPYLGMTNLDVRTKVASGFRLDRPMACGMRGKDCPLKVFKQMQLCWNKDPKKRPSFYTLSKVFSDFADSFAHSKLVNAFEVL